MRIVIKMIAIESLSDLLLTVVVGLTLGVGANLLGYWRLPEDLGWITTSLILGVILFGGATLLNRRYSDHECN